MKWLLLSLFLINAFASLAEIELDEMKAYLKKEKSFNALEKKACEAQQFARSKGEADFGYKYWACTFSIGRHYFDVMTIGVNDSIKMIIAVSRIYDAKLDEVIYDTAVNYVNTVFAKTYLSKHNKLYRTQLLIKSFKKPSYSMFGIACGGAGSPTSSTIQMTKLVNQQKEKQLILLASSVHANDRIHGTVGLYMIKKNGFAISKLAEHLIKTNQASIATVNYCSGCTEGPYSQMNSLLTEEQLQEYYYWYSQYGWNREF